MSARHRKVLIPAREAALTVRVVKVPPLPEAEQLPRLAE
jgi:hypothetical protein